VGSAISDTHVRVYSFWSRFKSDAHGRPQGHWNADTPWNSFIPIHRLMVRLMALPSSHQRPHPTFLDCADWNFQLQCADLLCQLAAAERAVAATVSSLLFEWVLWDAASIFVTLSNSCSVSLAS